MQTTTICKFCGKDTQGMPFHTCDRSKDMQTKTAEQGSAYAINGYAQSLLKAHEARLNRVSGRFLRLCDGDAVMVLDQNRDGMLLVQEPDGIVRQWAKASFMARHMPCK